MTHSPMLVQARLAVPPGWSCTRDNDPDHLLQLRPPARRGVAPPGSPHPELPRPELPHPELPRPELPRPELPRPELPRPEVVVRRSQAEDDSHFLSDYLAGLHRAEVEDSDRFEIGDAEVTYSRISHLGLEEPAGAVELVSEIWWRIEAGAGWAVIATVARAGYAQWCDLLDDLAGTLEIS